MAPLAAGIPPRSGRRHRLRAAAVRSALAGSAARLSAGTRKPGSGPGAPRQPSRSRSRYGTFS